MNDDLDLFDDNFVSARIGAHNPKALPKALNDLTDAEVSALDTKHRSIRNRKKSTRRTLEGTASNKIRDHLFKHHKAITTRVNSGSWVDDAGNTIRGAEAGTSDILACVPITIGALTFGIYFAFEVKSIENSSSGTDLQKAFIARVLAAGGAGCVVRTILDVDAAIDAKRQQMIGALRKAINTQP